MNDLRRNSKDVDQQRKQDSVSLQEQQKKID